MEARIVCAICEKKSTLRCGGCENVYYCSKQHQRRDWSRHVDVCKPYKLAENSALGRHYVATRNIKAGEIIFKEETPLISGPMFSSVPVCLGCLTALSRDTAIPCEKCGWPLCSDCKTHGPECNFTATRRKDKVSITEFSLPHPSYRCISLIRGLCLKERDRDSYEKLLSLQSNYEVDKQDIGNPSDPIQFVKRFFESDDLSVEEMEKIMGILQINGHEVPLTEPAHVAVYYFASFLEHNCTANCSKSFTDAGGLIIHAATFILKGTHISISYTDSLWGTETRRYHLSTTKFFNCTCDRCRDPTEFGTMFSAVKCRQTAHCSGHLLPHTFLTEKPNDWKCNSCGSTVARHEIEQLLDSIGVDLLSIKKQDVAACEEFLTRHKIALHENHYFNVDVTLALSQLIGRENGGIAAVSDDLLLRKLDLCRHIAELLKILAPAEKRTRGMILYELHVATSEYAKRNAKTPEVTRLKMLEMKNLLSEASDLLKYEPEVLVEGKMALVAQRNLKEITRVLDNLNM